MTLIEQLKNANIISSDNNILLDEALYKKIANKLIINLVLDRAIPLNEYNALTEKTNKIVEPYDVILELSIGYKDETLTDAELKEYLVEILHILVSSSARFGSLEINDCIISDNTVTFRVPHDALGFKDLCDPIKKAFEGYGLSINVDVEKDEEKSIQKEIEAIDQKILDGLERQAKEAEAAQKFNKVIDEGKKKRYSSVPEKVSRICDIPRGQTELSVYMNEYGGEAKFLLNCYIFGFEFGNLTKNKKYPLKIKVTDETDSIIIKKYIPEAELEEYQNMIKTNVELEVVAKAEYDSWEHNVVLIPSIMKMTGTHKKETVLDEYPEKRVELHLHTKMSALDGLTEAGDYVKQAVEWGWKGIALTDLNGVYAIPDIEHALADLKDKAADFKPIYGTELSLVDDSKYFITFNKRDINLKEATYIVFDLETTGFSQEYDRIIEIAAHKVRNGMIIDEFETFVNPEMPISEKITRLTSITNETVRDAETIDKVMPKFLEFIGDSILVAHNAKFDVGMIYANCERLGINVEEFSVIDTLNLFRAGYYDKVKLFGLKALCKYFKVKQEQHHRASDDTRVTALCFIQMLNDLYQRGIDNYQDINSVINPDEHWKHLISKESHVTILAKNKAGNKNLYKLVSDALTVHMYKGEAKALKSEIAKYREGLLIGSSSANGEIWNLASTRSLAELKEAMEYYDYIEVSPPSCYMHMYDSYLEGKNTICEIIKKIITVAKEMNKIVVATSDCYYLRPSDKRYREILITTPRLGGGAHDLLNVDAIPNNHLRSTSEMMEEFDFLDKSLAKEIVVTNTNLILDMVEKFNAFSKDMFAPRDDQFKDNPVVNYVKSINEESRRIVYEHVSATYGENPHPIIVKRVERELNSIISSGYMSVYYISHLLVKRSLDDGYLVGSRGSVGSSLVATMMDITEVNPLKPHYVCKKCKFHTLKMTKEEILEYGLSDLEKPFQDQLQKADSGFDLVPGVCPVCGNKLSKNGQDIPFETFLGFEGDKTPDIDLNFSGEYQAKAHEYIRTVFGNDHAFRGGTVATIADKIGYGYVRGYCEKKGIDLRDAEVERLASHLDGVRRSTGQHPGGIVVVPNYVDIYDVTPFQFPADDTEAVWRTTHYDYHKFEANLLKFDILGHDDPTIIRYLMNYVNAHQDEFPFDKAQDIPIDDPELYKLFRETEVIGLTKEQLGCEVASYAVPEYGTNFVQKMLVETKPQTFAQLIKISGLSHGTDVWNTNAQDLVNGKTEFGPIPFADVIGCRDDIMVDLMRFGMSPKDSFDIMEFVRKGKLYKGGKDKWEKYVVKMREANVPEWYIFSCSKIKYMFPKAHAIAYVMMALRIAWFKVYYPKLFYSAWLSKRAKGHDVKAYLGGPIAIKAKLDELRAIKDSTAKTDDLITALQVALEMTLRGFKFLPVDIKKSDATVFTIEENGNLRIPFVAVDGLGESAALDIVAKREEHEFTSKKDVLKRTRLNNTLYEEFNLMHFFGDLPDEEKEVEQGLFAFM